MELTRLKESTKRYAIEDLTIEINQINESYVSLRTKQEQYDQLLSRAARHADGFGCGDDGGGHREPDT